MLITIIRDREVAGCENRWEGMTVADQVPAGCPSRMELWRRAQLALSVLNHRGPSTATAVLVRRILLGEVTCEPPRG